MTRLLLPLAGDRSAWPAWRELLATADATRPAPAEAAEAPLTVVIDGAGRDAAWLTEALAGLPAPGVIALGQVDAGYATRPLPELLDEIEYWAGQRVCGIFLDRAPTSSYCLGTVALATRAAHRAGLSEVVLNPGVPPDRRYRDLPVAICAFEGAWPEYRRWTGEGGYPGDGHLVHSVPAGELPHAWQLLRQRRAGFGLVTDAPATRPYARPPAWLPGYAAVAGNSGRRTTTGW